MGDSMSIVFYLLLGWMLFNAAFAACFILPPYRH